MGSTSTNWPFLLGPGKFSVGQAGLERPPPSPPPFLSPPHGASFRSASAPAPDRVRTPPAMHVFYMAVHAASDLVFVSCRRSGSSALLPAAEPPSAMQAAELPSASYGLGSSPRTRLPPRPCAASDPVPISYRCPGSSALLLAAELPSAMQVAEPPSASYGLGSSPHTRLPPRPRTSSNQLPSAMQSPKALVPISMQAARVPLGRAASISVRAPMLPRLPPTFGQPDGPQVLLAPRHQAITFPLSLSLNLSLSQTQAERPGHYLSSLPFPLSLSLLETQA